MILGVFPFSWSGKSKMSSFVAMQLSGNSHYDGTKEGFASREEAKQWIYEHNCEHCRKEIDRGFTYFYIHYRYGDNELFIEEPQESSIMGTDCSAEWDIVTQEEFRSYFENQEEYDNYIEKLNK